MELPVKGLKIMVVDDNSPDGTGKLAEELAGKFPGRISVLHREGKGGLGSAYRFGFHKAIEAGADTIGQMDSDFSHPPEKLVEMISLIEDNDLVIGSRYVPGGSVDLEWPLWRKGLSAWGNFYARTILGLPLRDLTGGFRIWKREALMKVPWERVKSSGYIFQVEMAYIATKLGYKIAEVPIYFADRKWGQSKMDIRVQFEAAVRVWSLKSLYRDLFN
jgi:dolichol-phosphate mannosyltransferase